MREIRFRAWDIKNKKYYYDVQNTYDENIGDNFQSIINSENFIVEQDIGLEDTNGVSIYENDIIEISDTSYGDNKKHYGVVEYNEYAELVVGNILLSRVYNTIKVITNKNENKNLLENDHV